MQHHSRPPIHKNVLWPLLAALASLVATGSLWLQVRSVQSETRALRAELYAARGMPLIDIAGAPELGLSKAALTLIEFADYECPFCIRHFAETMPRLEEQFIRSGQLRYVFRDLPIDALHPGALRAHEAAHCAAEQGKFWELHRRLFSEPGSHGDESLATRASEAGLDRAAFDSCLSSGRTTSVVRKSVATAAALGANGTPTFFLGVAEGAPNQIRVFQVLAGAQPYEEFQRVIATVSASLQR